MWRWTPPFHNPRLEIGLGFVLWLVGLRVRVRVGVPDLMQHRIFSFESFCLEDLTILGPFRTHINFPLQRTSFCPVRIAQNILYMWRNFEKLCASVKNRLFCWITTLNGLLEIICDLKERFPPFLLLLRSFQWFGLGKSSTNFEDTTWSLLSYIEEPWIFFGVLGPAGTYLSGMSEHFLPEKEYISTWEN